VLASLCSAAPLAAPRDIHMHYRTRLAESFPSPPRPSRGAHYRARIAIYKVPARRTPGGDHRDLSSRARAETVSKGGAATHLDEKSDSP